MIKNFIYLVLAIVAVIIMWKIATYDWCQVWYGIKCMPPYEQAK